MNLLVGEKRYNKLQIAHSGAVTCIRCSNLLVNANRAEIINTNKIVVASQTDGKVAYMYDHVLEILFGIQKRATRCAKVHFPYIGHNLFHVLEKFYAL